MGTMESEKPLSTIIKCDQQHEQPRQERVRIQWLEYIKRGYSEQLGCTSIQWSPTGFKPGAQQYEKGKYSSLEEPV